MSPYFKYFSLVLASSSVKLLQLDLHLFYSNHLIKLKQTLVTISELSYNHHVPSNVTTNEGSPVKFLTIWERRRFESIATSWAKILTQTHTSPVGVASGHLGTTQDSTSRVRSVSHTQGPTSCQDVQAQPAHRLMSGFPYILTTSTVHTFIEQGLA